MFLTGSELSSLRPCGCSGGQLGGLEKRSAVFDSVEASRRLVVETGGLVQTDREQDLMKFRILFEALKLLRYDVVHLTDQDFELATRLGLMAEQHGFEIIDAATPDPPAVFAKRFAARGRDITVNVLSIRNREPQAPEVPSVDILILPHYDPDLLKALVAQASDIECVVCPSDTDEPRLVSKPGEVPLVLTVGRFGRYICRLDVTIEERTGQPALRFESIPVQAKLPDNQVLLQLYRQYQQLVGQSDLLENYPRVPLPEKLAFTGSPACKRCHEYEYDQWSTKPHANALASLVKAGSDRDPECVVCHVVGMEYQTGYVSEDKTSHLKDVGCENCHGPGSEHVQTYGQVGTKEPKMTCTKCHTPEKSTGFAGQEEEYMQKIIHWREPATPGNVKN
ncbi:MAG: hypothetical protein A2Y76_03055 [Planctomycetes bacterium RBG_13_60_9]|nr:MAG: hypothetical protein A2Y76_03055 [Planctomycetes bacterium RBG_13_60_9]